VENVMSMRLVSHSSPPGQVQKNKSKSSSPKDPPSSGSFVTVGLMTHSSIVEVLVIIKESIALE